MRYGAIAILTILMIGNISRLAAQVDTCGCFDGNGTSAANNLVMLVALENVSRVSVCGFVWEPLGEGGFLVSEFTVFDCTTSEALAAYGADEICQIEDDGGQLVITRVKYLPAGTGWKWMFVPVGIQHIYSARGRITVTDLEPQFEPIDIERAAIERFLADIVAMNRAGNLGGLEPEEVLGRLEILALNGNQLAYDILMDFEKFFNIITDGAVKSIWKDAKATVQWVGR